MNEYQQEQLEALQLARKYLASLSDAERDALIKRIGPYLAFREKVDLFLATHFSDICSRRCYRNKLSACCSKDGILIFFADTFINALQSSRKACDHLETRLRSHNTSYKCIYLAEDGCLWTVKPIVCQMFLCNRAEEAVFEENPNLRDEWERLLAQKKVFTWPDEPVLFDFIESLCIKAGISSSLMHLHNSPGLLRVKQKAGLL